MDPFAHLEAKSGISTPRVYLNGLDDCIACGDDSPEMVI